MIRDSEIDKTVLQFIWEDKKEIPCKDMDIDCLPDNQGHIPFGNYLKCFLYEPDKGSCPFQPI